MVVYSSGILSIKEWYHEFTNLPNPLLIAGPCSAETEQQVLETARHIKDIKNIIFFRSGLWKPRTRPSSFQGVGEKGLPWLKRVKDEYGIKIITEVASPYHLEKVLEYNFDAIWIGARTTANPFAVQEIAEALKGVDIPVFIKNPINPDLELWIGAIERINKAGIKKIAAIHRGFSNYEKTRYRNLPQWQIPIDLKTYIPQISLLCDPSHISGNSDYIYELSQEAMDLDFDGLMIETHINPKEALSDANQQITPAQLKQILSSLIIRKPETDNYSTIQQIEELRKKIDILDDHLLTTLEQRMKLVRKIGELKNKNGITILQSERWKNILSKALEKGKRKGLDATFINKLFKLIHQEAITIQAKIMDKKIKK
jgi:chorismate mutase